MKCIHCNGTIRQPNHNSPYYCLVCGEVQVCEMCGAELYIIKSLDDIQVCDECFIANQLELFS